MSDWQIEFHPGAERDLVEGFEWYAERNPDSAIAFRSAILNARSVIIRSPKTWPSYHSGTQKYKVKHFPYKVIFLVSGNLIQIVAVAHDRRRANFWSDRLK